MRFEVLSKLVLGAISIVVPLTSHADSSGSTQNSGFRDYIESQLGPLEGTPPESDPSCGSDGDLELICGCMIDFSWVCPKTDPPSITTGTRYGPGQSPEACEIYAKVIQKTFENSSDRMNAECEITVEILPHPCCYPDGYVGDKEKFDRAPKQLEALNKQK